MLEVEELRVEAARSNGITLVDGISFMVRKGECLGIVGESGSGKSMTLRAVSGLPPARIVGGRVTVGRVSMVFQDPMSALNPTMRVGDLVAEGLRARGMTRAASRSRVIELLDEVQMPAPERRARSWPHELSGGLRQRVMIAMALSVEPDVLLCDEPTTALDVTIQDQVLTLLERLRAERHLGVVFVSHDLAVISRVADHVAVMYGGTLVETGPVNDVVRAPRHPYTLGLLGAVPDPDRGRSPLTAIRGQPPDPTLRPTGCPFAARCASVEDACEQSRPLLTPVGTEHHSACRRSALLAGSTS